MTIRTKILLELYTRKILGYILILSMIFLISLLFGKFKETIFLLLAYGFSRTIFEKQFHCSSTIKCIQTTILIFTLAILMVVRYNLSLLQCLVIGISINYITGIYALIPSKEIKLKTKRDMILSVVSNNEDDIDKLCAKYGLVNISETIYLYLNNTLEETADILEVNQTTITRRINKFLQATLNK